MRKIKFRGLDSEGVWHYGNLLQSKPFKDGRIDCWIQPKTLLCLGAVSTPTSSFVKVIENTIGQFTGLTNKNGVDIYEGDVISCDFDGNNIRNCKVIFDDCMFILYSVVNSQALIDVAGCDIFEVIGNIHQHPELLENR